MAVKLKSLSEQTIVLTGASSGIGLATARMAASRGAKLVLVARSDNALHQLEAEINGNGGHAVAVPGDTADPATHERAAQVAAERFQGVDTWVNNAAVGHYGRLREMPIDDARRLFDVNFWGYVHGSLTAVKHLPGRGAGVLINVGSVESDRAIPLHGYYSATKHAVKAFTDALRMELEEENAPVYVSLIKPGAIDTPFPRNARNYTPNEPTLPPPVYAPNVVARAILHCATHPHRDLIVGGGGKLLSAQEKWMPRLADKFMERSLFTGQFKDEPHHGDPERSLYRPSESLSERGDYDGHVMRVSAYTAAAKHPVLAGVLTAGLGALAVAALAGADVPVPKKRRRQDWW